VCVGVGILGQVADEDDVVDVGHSSLSSQALSVSVSVISVQSTRAAAPLLALRSRLGRAGRALTTRRTAMWRMTPSVIFRTREISASVAGSAAKVRR
jgi:hypothetical protein